MADVIAEGDPNLKAKVYADLGIRLVYRPDERVLAVEAAPVSACATARVGGAFTPERTPVLRGELALP